MKESSARFWQSSGDGDFSIRTLFLREKTLESMQSRGRLASCRRLSCRSMNVNEHEHVHDENQLMSEKGVHFLIQL